MGLNVNDFIHIELVSFTTDHYDNGKKIKVIDRTVYNNIYMRI